MNFYRHRPLALALTIGMTVSVLSAYLPAIGRIFLFVGFAVILTALYFSERLIHDTAVKFGHFMLIGYREFLVLTAIISTAMVLTSFAFWSGTVGNFEKMADSSAYRISATVTAVRSDKSFGSIYEVVPDDRGIKGLLLADSGYAVGDKLVGSIRYYDREEIESMNYRYTSLLADRIVFVCTSLTESEFQELTADTAYLPLTAVGQKTDGFTMLWIKIRGICRAVLSVFLDSDTDCLVAALLLGDKSGLGIVRRDISRIGASHLFALSGMHLVILVGMTEKLTKKLPKQIRIYLTLLFLVGYSALVGFPYSVVRAAVMMAIFKIGQLFFIDSDSVTSLFFAGGIILLCDPAAVFDVGFVLSFTATLGVLLIGSAVPELHKKKKKTLSGKAVLYENAWTKLIAWLSRTAVGVGKKTVAVVMTTLGATCFLLPFQYLYFGEFSLMSIVSALLLTPLCELILCIAVPFLIAALCRFHLLVGRLGLLLSILADIVEHIARTLSDKSTLISLRYDFILPIMLLFFAVIAVMIYRNLSNWLYALIPYGVAVLLITGGSHLYENYRADIPTLTAFTTAHGDMFSLRTDKKSMLIDISDGTLSPMYQSLTVLDNDCVTEVDTLMLTHLHTRHITALRRLCENIMVRNILIPEPVGDSDRAVADRLTELAESLGVSVYTYPHEETAVIQFGDSEIMVAAKTMLKRSTHPVIGLLFGYDNIQTAYLGSSYTETDRSVPNADVILLGTHGPIAKKEIPETVSENPVTVSMQDTSPIVVSRKTVKPTDR